MLLFSGYVGLINFEPHLVSVTPNSRTPVSTEINEDSMEYRIKYCRLVSILYRYSSQYDLKGLFHDKILILPWELCKLNSRTTLDGARNMNTVENHRKILINTSVS